MTLENGNKIQVLNLNDLKDSTDMGQYGFLEDTRADELLLAIHCADSTSKFNAFELLQNPLTASPQSISFVSKENHPTFSRIGVVLEVSAENVINATHYDQGSGKGKSVDDLVKLATSKKYSSLRELIPNMIKNELKIDDEAYAQLVSQVEEHRYLTPSINDEIFKVTNSKGEEITIDGLKVRETIIQANLELINMAQEGVSTNNSRRTKGDITEYVTSNISSTGIYYVRYDSIEDAKIYPELAKFLSELPDGAQVIFGGYEGDSYSKKRAWK